MFRLGVEEPIVDNESLYMREEESSVLVLDRAEGLRLNRYTLVSSDDESGQAIGLAVQKLLSLLDLRVFVLLSWLAQLPGKSAVASKVIEKRYEKRGWRVHPRRDHDVAARETSAYEIDTWPPLHFDPNDGGYILLAASCDEDQVMRVLDAHSSKFLARTHYLAPSRTLLRSLEATGCTLLYGVTHELGYPGIVQVGPLRIDQKELARHVEIGEVLVGESAYKALVWG